tara:strand:+ start:966 stop:1247 length:282 start_codon:yes stop_codon:yes gene_type:complete
MKKLIFKTLSFVVIAGVLTSCAVSAPLLVTSNAVGTKTGTSSYKVVFGISPMHSESGAIAAARNGNITKIATVDQTVKGSLFTTTVTTVVTGE